MKILFPFIMLLAIGCGASQSKMNAHMRSCERECMIVHNTCESRVIPDVSGYCVAQNQNCLSTCL